MREKNSDVWFVVNIKTSTWPGSLDRNKNWLSVLPGNCGTAGCCGGAAGGAGWAGCGRGAWIMSMRHVGQLCWRWNHERRQLLWKMWLQGSFLQPDTISSRQMMHTSLADNSSGVASG